MSRIPAFSRIYAAQVSPRTWSILAWVSGGIVGALLAKQHRALGFLGGMLLTGAIADKFIETHHPSYLYRYN